MQMEEDDNEGYPCDQCESVFTSITALSIHMKLKHNVQLVNLNDENETIAVKQEDITEEDIKDIKDIELMDLEYTFEPLIMDEDPVETVLTPIKKERIDDV